TVPGLGVPPMQARLQSGRYHRLAVRTNRYGEHILLHAAEREFTPAGSPIDHFDRSVLAGRHQPLPVGTECDAINEVGVMRKRAFQLEAAETPDLDRLVEASGGQMLTVRREGD